MLLLQALVEIRLVYSDRGGDWRLTSDGRSSVDAFWTGSDAAAPDHATTPAIFDDELLRPPALRPVHHSFPAPWTVDALASQSSPVDCRWRRLRMLLLTPTGRQDRQSADDVDGSARTVSWPGQNPRESDQQIQTLYTRTSERTVQQTVQLQQPGPIM